ncbi:unnamed protein product [Gemmataceae bacterium]|nr:unnamed protein product [Gemmataceae bacterium]VTT97194.1 unnamed protein product [Gemmataceae bacterium]
MVARIAFLSLGATGTLYMLTCLGAICPVTIVALGDQLGPPPDIDREQLKAEPIVERRFSGGGVVTFINTEHIIATFFDNIEVSNAREVSETPEERIWVSRKGRLLTVTQGIAPKIHGVRVVSRGWGNDTIVVESGETLQLPLEGRQARTFIARGVLAAGGYPPLRDDHGTRLPESYRLRDVKVGDWVLIEYTRRNGVDFLDAVVIARRPGGKVPAAPWEDDLAREGNLPKARYHEWRNAHWDWVERRIPYPDLYHPGGSEAGVAPPPRHALDKAPAPRTSEPDHIPPARP